MTGSLLRIREQLETLTPAERRVAEYFLSHAESLVGTSIADLAAACDTGKSSVVQLCKRVGFRGYKDFCNALSAEMAVGRHIRIDEFPDLYPDAPVDQICRTVANKSVLAIESTMEMLDTREMERAVETLLHARSVTFFAMGGSAIVAEDACYKFRRLGMAAYFAQDAHLQLQSAALLTDRDAAFFVSYHGRTREMIELIRMARGRGAACVAMTRHGRNPVGDQAAIRLSVSSNESLMRVGAMSSRLAMLTLVDMLQTCLAGRMGPEGLDALERTAEAAKTRRQ